MTFYLQTCAYEDDCSETKRCCRFGKYVTVVLHLQFDFLLANSSKDIACLPLLLPLTNHMDAFFTSCRRQHVKKNDARFFPNPGFAGLPSYARICHERYSRVWTPQTRSQCRCLPSSDKYRVRLIPKIPRFVHMVQAKHVFLVLQQIHNHVAILQVPGLRISSPADDSDFYLF